MRRPSWNAAEAALLPSPARTAYHAIKESGQLRRGETILITAASGELMEARTQLGTIVLVP